MATILQPEDPMSVRPSTASQPEAPAGVNDPVRRQVTVVIAAWRASATIGKAVASALAQPEAAEVVVVDDASNDDGATMAAARAADDGAGRLQVFALEKNSGPARARNAAIRASKAPWITVLDSDDYMMPGRLAKLTALGDGYDFVADDLKQVEQSDPTGTLRAMWFDDDNVAPIDISLAYFLDGCISRPDRRRRELGFLKPLMRRAFLERHGLAYDEGMRLGEDFDLYSRALSGGAKMRLSPWTGYVSVMRMGSLSLAHKREDLVALLAGKDRLLASGKLSQEETRLLKQVRSTSEGRLVWVDFVTALKKGNPFKAAWLIIKHPEQTPHLLRTLGGAIARKFSRQ